MPFSLQAPGHSPGTGGGSLIGLGTRDEHAILPVGPEMTLRTTAPVDLK